MSRLREMIEELCPDGVEYRKLGEIAEIVRGNGLQKKDFVDSGVGCIHYGQIYTKFGAFADKTLTYVTPELAATLKKVSTGDLVVAITSENVEDVCKCVAWLGNGDIVTGGHAAIVKHEQNPKYLSYVFQTEEFFRQKRKYVIGTKVIEMSPKKLAEIIIPVPPLPIQNEIVKLLDNFTELTAELTAELALRKKQYNFYRDSLLNFVRVDDTIAQTDRQTIRRIGKIGGLKQAVEVEWKTLGEVCDLIAGGDVPKGEFSQVVTEEYRIPIYSNGIGEKALYGFTKSPRITQPCVTISARGTIGYSALHLTPFYPVVRLIAAIPYKCLDVKYLFYMLQMTTFKIPQTGIPQLTIPMVKTYSIPIPPLETQAKIVSILDRFDALCHDLTQGLPAEIAARKKQYEYYRDKLLTFPRKDA